jgi:nucleotide-binding universal stress UspA family protein
MPLASYPDAVEDGAIEAALGLAAAIGCEVETRAFAVDLPRASSGLGDYLVNVSGVIQAAEERSRSECERLHALVSARNTARFETRTVSLGMVSQAAAVEARYFDLTLLPWSAAAGEVRDLTQEIVFESGRPAILVPASAPPARIDHIAIAWDGSRVAARALGDALPLLAAEGQVSVITVEDDKPLAGRDIGGALASWLEKRGYRAAAVTVPLDRQPISDLLQSTARARGAQLLAVGGFGHSRIRDFILGGATKGMLSRVEMPVLLSH